MAESSKLSTLSKAKDLEGKVWNRTYREEIKKGKSEGTAKSIANKKAKQAKLNAIVAEDIAIGARTKSGTFKTSFPLGLKKFKNKREMEKARKAKKLEIRKKNKLKSGLGIKDK